MSIKFGTSGWRAIVADEFTFSNVRKVSKAIAGYAKAHCARKKAAPQILIGYDTRFNSGEFASAAARVLAASGVKALLANRDTPTSAISFQVIDKKLDGAINITASHNPPEYNGIKFSPSHGGPASPAVTKDIEWRIAKIKGEVKEPPEKFKYPVERIEPKPAYLAQVTRLVDLAAIRKAGLKVVVDLMHGTGRGYLDELLDKAGCETQVLNDEIDPLFGGHSPEPSRENLEGLIAEVKKHGADIGVALDGDADRFGIVDERGRFYTPNEIFSLLFEHMANTRGLNLRQVARTHATTTLIDRIAAEHGLEVVETPVGFKYIGEVLMKGDCIIGGEESGGLSIANHIPEKDGILACLLVAEMVAVKEKPLSRILEDLYRRFGRPYAGRINFILQDEQKSRLLETLRRHPPKEMAGLKVLRQDRTEGLKFILEDSSWVLVRPSGTEPLVRFYYEAYSRSKAGKLENFGRGLAASLKSPGKK